MKGTTINHTLYSTNYVVHTEEAPHQNNFLTPINSSKESIRAKGWFGLITWALIASDPLSEVTLDVGIQANYSGRAIDSTYEAHSWSTLFEGCGSSLENNLHGLGQVAGFYH